MIRTRTIIDALFYLLSHLKQADKVQLVKLIYLADKYHLIRYGRTITQDQYLAMEYGPVGSAVLDVLNFKGDALGDDLEYAEAQIKKTGLYGYMPATGCVRDVPDHLSETDIEALDFVLDRFGKMDTWEELVPYTHKYREWKQHEEALTAGDARSMPIGSVELLSVIDESDPLGMPPEHIKDSEAILTGTYD